jgi:MFS family permease
MRESSPIVGYLSLGSLWFALQAQWTTVVPIIVPDQIAAMVGETGSKEGITGSIVAAGSVIALLIPPLAGTLSDRTRAVRGRRRPYLIVGMLGTCLGLLSLVPFGLGSSLMLYALALINLQFWWNWAAGPYAGLIPDVVAEKKRPMATGWMNLLGVVGTVTGNGLVAVAYIRGAPLTVMLCFVGINLACLALTLRNVTEPAAPGIRFAGITQFVASFYLRPHEHPNFYWVLITRFFSNMGIWWIFTFLLFYLEQVVGEANPANLLPLLLGTGAAVAIPTSLLGVKMAERFGIVEVARATSWIVALCAICYVLIALRPSLNLLIPVMIAFSAAYGAYQAVDWALALSVLPSGDHAGKDMGIWHISMVLPQVLGPAISGWLITGISAAVSPKAAYVIAFAIAAVWLILAAFYLRRVRLPAQATGRAVVA